LTAGKPDRYTEINRGDHACAAFKEIPSLANVNSKMARAKERREKSKLAAFETPVTMEDHLARLEEEIRRLKVEFDIYFNGGSKRPPYDTKARVESHLKRLGDDRTLTFAQRYYYNSLATRYAAFRELWRRMMQGREEGTAVVRALHVDDTPFTRSEFSCADVRHDVQTIKGVYDALVKAKRTCGEPIQGLSFAKFHRLVLERSDAIKEKAGADRVSFSVDIESGHVSFKAKAEK
jgi:hypothetical protein